MDISPAKEVEDNNSLSTDTTEGRGGTKAWLTVFGSSLVYFSTFGIINSFGFFQELYQDDYLPATSPTTIAFIGTLQITLMNVLAAPAGSLFDNYGFKFLYLCSGLGGSCALVALSFSKPQILWQLFVIQGVLLGTFIAFGAQPALVIVVQHFVRRRALTMGLVAAAGSGGGFCFPLIFARLAPHIGFAWTLRVVAAIFLFIRSCFVVAFYVSSTNAPEEPNANNSALLDFEGFRDITYSVTALGAFIARYNTLAHRFQGSYCTSANPHSSAKDYLLPLMNAASLTGRILGGLTADTTSATDVVYPMTISSGLQCLALWLVSDNIGILVAFVILYGFCSGVFIALLPVIVANVSPSNRLGGRIGAFYSVLAIAQLIGAPIAGSLIGPGEGYARLIIFAGTTLIVGGLIIFASKYAS
ncbi:MFS general substrate transporter, partial [Lophiostoma macrostomum CBS 122681]